MKVTHATTRVIFLLVLLNFLPTTLLAKEILLYDYEVINTYPHDPEAFTQGLIFYNGYLYESTGNYDHSSLRKVELKTGKIIKIKNNNRQYFAEGLTRYKGQFLQLSWRAGKAFVYNIDSFEQINTFNYAGEGWGLTTHDNQLIMSDGSSNIRFLDPLTFKENKRLNVTKDGQAVRKLNELEMVKGKIFANVWLSNLIVIISPETGQVSGIIDLTGLLEKNTTNIKANILNGIAYDKDGDRLFVTGKYWPKLFEIRLVPQINP